MRSVAKGIQRTPTTQLHRPANPGGVRFSLWAGYPAQRLRRRNLLASSGPEKGSSSKGSDVVETLEQVTRAYGMPKEVRVDNGPEFISKDLDLWAYMNGVALEFSRPGKPTENAFIESFNGKLREECLNASWFLSRKDARSKCEAWRREYNELRPHSSIGQQTPVEFASASGQGTLPRG